MFAQFKNGMLVQLFNSFSVAGLLRYLQYKFLGRDIIISGKCLQCGSCCREMTLDIDGGWITTMEDFTKLVTNNPDYSRLRYLHRGTDGLMRFSCTWLTEEGKCRDHKNRLEICRNFPDREMFFMNGRLPQGCGYAVTQTVPFDRVLKSKLKRAASGRGR